MTTTKQYQFLNRLQSSSSSPASSSSISFSYSYNAANQRIRRTDADGSYWRYEYDALGQVRSGRKYWSDSTPVAGQQFEYGHDDIGNRTSTKAGGDASGAGLRPASYSPNSLNQYTARDVPGAVDVMGVALATSTVTVNGLPVYRRGEYFRKELPVSNGSSAVWASVTVAATGQASVSGNAFVPQTPEQFAYDLDGNLLSDGRWNYTWDPENRLVKVESLPGGPAASKRRVAWEYDAKGRRIRQTTYDGSSGNYVVTEDLKFLSDGWRHIGELNASNNALVRSYAWGLDLSGTLDGAGGVGGLLMMSSAANGVHFYAYDGNGNVAALVKAADGTVSAQYEYEPFGQTLRATGLVAKESPFRFSTKRTDNTTDHVLYEYRAYGTGPGRWLSRDSAEEDGGLNLYSFAGNDLVSTVDRLGLVIVCACPEQYFQENGITADMYFQDGLAYVGKWGMQGPTSGTGEILWKMLLASRVFTAEGLRVEELERHVASRQNVLKAIDQVRWIIGHDRGFNPKYWADERGTVRWDAAGGVNDMFTDPDTYTRGCRATTRIILLKGVLDTIGPTAFNNAIGTGGWIDSRAFGAHLLMEDDVPIDPMGLGFDWVPGDVGYIQGKNPDHMLNGERVVYKGGMTWWGAVNRPPKERTLMGWIQTVKGWSTDPNFRPYVASTRIYPGVGLRWHPPGR